MSESRVIELVGRPDRVEPGPDGTTHWLYGNFISDWIVFRDGQVVEAVQF